MNPNMVPNVKREKSEKLNLTKKKEGRRKNVRGMAAVELTTVTQLLMLKKM